MDASFAVDDKIGFGGKMFKKLHSKILEEIVEDVMKNIEESFAKEIDFEEGKWQERSGATSIIEGTPVNYPLLPGVLHSYKIIKYNDEYYQIFSDNFVAIIAEFGIPPVDTSYGKTKIPVTKNMRSFFNSHGIRLKQTTTEIKIPKRGHLRSSINRTMQKYPTIANNVISYTWPRIR